MPHRSAIEGKGVSIQYAKLKHADGTLLLPATTPYDKDNLLEEASIYAGRHGVVTLEMSHFDHPTLRVRSLESDDTVRCSRCGCYTNLAFRNGKEQICRACTKEYLLQL